MPTPKQVRHHYKRIRFHMWNLHKALCAAHDAHVIDYPGGTYNENAPCAAFGELRTRVMKTTEKARAEAFHNEVIKELKNAY